MKRIILLIMILLFSCLSVPAYAHPGSLDENGGHWNHKTGEYHYHTGEHTEDSSSTSSESYSTDEKWDCTQDYDEELEKALAEKEEKNQSQENETIEEVKNEPADASAKETFWERHNLPNPSDWPKPVRFIVICLSCFPISFPIIILLFSAAHSILKSLFSFVFKRKEPIQDKSNPNVEALDHPKIEEAPPSTPGQDEKYPIPERVVRPAPEPMPDPDEYLWFEWPESTHQKDGQADRIQRAVNQNIKIEKRITEETYLITGTQGNKYQTSLKSCTCTDFSMRHLPCKHMYALAISQGLFSQRQYLQGEQST